MDAEDLKDDELIQEIREVYNEILESDNNITDLGPIVWLAELMQEFDKRGYLNLELIK
jgi:hypothetical protein